MWINQFITQSISWLHSALGIKNCRILEATKWHNLQKTAMTLTRPSTSKLLKKSKGGQWSNCCLRPEGPKTEAQRVNSKGERAPSSKVIWWSAVSSSRCVQVKALSLNDFPVLWDHQVAYYVITLHYIIKNKQLQKSLDLAARRALPNPLGGQKSHEQGASTAARGFNHPDSTPPPMNSNNARQCLTMNQTEDTVRRCW